MAVITRSMNTRLTVFLGMVVFATIRTFAQGLDTWSFRGVLTTGLPGSPYQAGLAYSADFAVDTARLSPQSTGLYFPTVGHYFRIACCSVGASSLGSGVLVANDRPIDGGSSFDGIVFSMFGEQSTGFPAGTLFDGSATGVTLVSSSSSPVATPFTDTSFPSTLDLNEFSQRYMTVYFGGGAVQGSVDSLYLNGVLISQIPEPGFFSLLAVGAFILILHLTRRSRSEHGSDRPAR